MPYLTHDEFLKRVETLNSNYWNEGKGYRWDYMAYVIDQAQQLGAVRTIEAGASGIPLNSDSYLFDLPEHDLNMTPYKLYIENEYDNGTHEAPDKFFDLFIALQVWEHIDNQAAAFREVMRISKAAILSFPYMWNHGDKRHRGIDDAKIKAWTCGIEPQSVKIIHHRAIYVWKF